MRTRTKIVWMLSVLLALAGVVTVAIHLAPVRHLLGWAPLGEGKTSSGFCPFGYGKQPQKVAHSTVPHPALGFTLDVTTAEEVGSWAKANHVACVSQHGGTTLECSGVPAALLGDDRLDATTVWFTFPADGVLTSIQTVRRAPEVALVTLAFGSVERTVTRTVGAPTNRDGAATPEVLASASLRQAMVQFDRADYRVVLRVTNMGDGFVLTESYAAI